MIYLARTVESHELVGLFNVEDPDDAFGLFWLIDECCDPNIVEVRELPTNGGIMWPSDATKVPLILKDEDDDQEISLKGHSFTDAWMDAFYAEEDEPDAWEKIADMVEGIDLYGRVEAEG